MPELDALLGFAFETKTGKPKRKLQVTMATGRVVATDQFSQISFVRTHLGSFGNLLSQALKIRTEDHSELPVQSDLSTANLPGPTPPRMTLAFAGFAAHARRPFWRYREVDPLARCPHQALTDWKSDHLGNTKRRVESRLLDEVRKNTGPDPELVACA